MVQFGLTLLVLVCRVASLSPGDHPSLLLQVSRALQVHHRAMAALPIFFEDEEQAPASNPIPADLRKSEFTAPTRTHEFSEPRCHTPSAPEVDSDCPRDGPRN
ncbi:MAG: hypothetical protein JST40_12030 [Armatimonadetes bacterium]|nr:hypothetical protein [Armatimonadota bacterium]